MGSWKFNVFNFLKKSKKVTVPLVLLCPTFPNILFYHAVAEIWSVLLSMFDLLKNAVCIPCPIKNNWIGGFIAPLDPSSYSLTPGHLVTPIRPRDYLSTPWRVQLTPGGLYRPLWEPLPQSYCAPPSLRFRSKSHHLQIVKPYLCF